MLSIQKITHRLCWPSAEVVEQILTRSLEKRRFPVFIISFDQIIENKAHVGGKLRKGMGRKDKGKKGDTDNPRNHIE